MNTEAIPVKTGTYKLIAGAAREAGRPMEEVIAGMVIASKNKSGGKSMEQTNDLSRQNKEYAEIIKMYQSEGDSDSKLMSKMMMMKMFENVGGSKPQQTSAPHGNSMGEMMQFMMMKQMMKDDSGGANATEGILSAMRQAMEQQSHTTDEAVRNNREYMEAMMRQLVGDKKFEDIDQKFNLLSDQILATQDQMAAQANRPPAQYAAPPPKSELDMLVEAKEKAMAIGLVDRPRGPEDREHDLRMKEHEAEREMQSAAITEVKETLTDFRKGFNSLLAMATDNQKQTFFQQHPDMRHLADTRNENEKAQRYRRMEQATRHRQPPSGQPAPQMTQEQAHAAQVAEAKRMGYTPEQIAAAECGEPVPPPDGSVTPPLEVQPAQGNDVPPDTRLKIRE